MLDLRMHIFMLQRHIARHLRTPSNMHYKFKPFKALGLAESREIESPHLIEVSPRQGSNWLSGAYSRVRYSLHQNTIQDSIQKSLNPS